jgi:acetate kinase
LHKRKFRKVKILSINCGSSSVKYKLFDIGENQQLLASGVADRIGQSGSRISHKPADQKEQIFEKSLPQHRVALQEIYDILRNDKSGVAPDLDKIEGIGHRVVHGGMEFTGSIIIDDHVIETIRENAKFAPLHNPINIAGIEICRRLLPDVPNVAVFDTALHQTMPAKAFLYGLPMEQYEKYGIRRYGFQGISHAYVAKEAARIMKKPLEALKIITCHLGNGASVTAFKEGKSIDTSMGLTPLEGLVMATRSGDIDPSIILYLIESVGMSPAQVANMLNKDSGLKGLCGKSDIRDVLEAAALGNQSAKIALEIFCYRIQKYIGAYVASMNGLDVIVFTGGVGENSAYLREKILANFGYLGLEVDKIRNEEKESIFSTDVSAIQAMNITTNEELYIAIETYNVIRKTDEN